MKQTIILTGDEVKQAFADYLMKQYKIASSIHTMRTIDESSEPTCTLDSGISIEMNDTPKELR